MLKLNCISEPIQLFLLDTLTNTFYSCSLCFVDSLILLSFHDKILVMNSVSADCKTKIEPDHDKKYGVPSLEDLGKSEKECGPLLFPGGETEALRRLDSMMEKKVIHAQNIAHNMANFRFLNVEILSLYSSLFS